jgi:hypothetical protein
MLQAMLCLPARSLLLAALAGLCVTAGHPAAAAAQGNDGQLVSQLASVESEVIQSYMGKSTPNPPRYYSDGQWYAPEGLECWNCYDGAGTAAGVLFDQGIGGHEYEQIAIETTNRAIADRQQPNGMFEGSAAQSAGITTAFYAVQLGVSYFELRNVLGAPTRKRWAAALAAAADSLITAGGTTWYVNGNINLRETEVMWLAWKVTGNPYFKQQYESEWTFTMAPPQPRWLEFGLHLTVIPTDQDGSNGAGFLAESDVVDTPGFDPEYTLLQLDTATQMYVLSREARWLRLTNLLYNQLVPRIEVTPSPNSVWILNGLGGTRKNQLVPFTTAALYVLVAGGYRPELAGGLAAQFASIETEFRKAMSVSSANFYRDLAEELSTPMLDEQWPLGVDASTDAQPAAATRSALRKARAARERCRSADASRTRGRGARARRHSRAGASRGHRDSVPRCTAHPRAASGRRSGAHRASTNTHSRHG